MAIGSLTSPGTAVLQAALLDNGQPYVPPAGSTYAFSPSVTASDSSVSIVPDPTIPAAFDITIPSGDTSQSVTFNASAVAPDGTTIQAPPLVIPFAAVPQKFTMTLTQTA